MHDVDRVLAEAAKQLVIFAFFSDDFEDHTPETGSLAAASGDHWIG